MSTKQSLLDMGFATEKVLGIILVALHCIPSSISVSCLREKAVSTCGDDLEQAMEWLLAHADNSSIATGTSSENAALETENISKSEGDEITNAKTEESSEAAKSLKCDECGKLFKNSEEVEFHAVKSGHSSFSESTEEKKPLTEEERKQKVKDLEEKLKQRRREKEEEERKEAVEREKKRIQMSRNIAETKRRIQEEEMKRIADERRREKLEDKMARQRVREQIERDKEARKEMFGGGTKTNSAPSVSQPPQPVLTPAQKKEYDCTRLQIRLPSGSPLVQEFKSKESLSAVRLWVGINRKDKECTSQSFKLSTTFPRKIFDEEDMDKPLSVLGLVPSAVLVVTDN